MEKITSDPTTHEAIISTCDKLKTAMLARYEASRKETEVSLNKISAHKEVTLAKDALNSIHFD